MKYYILAIVSLSIVAFPPHVYAGVIPNGLQKTICQAGTQSKTSGSFMSASGAADELKQMVSTTNFCTNEAVKLDVGMVSGNLNDTITCICTNQKEFDSVGCEEGKTQPIVVITADKKTSGCATEVITLSKCVPDPEAAYKEACKSGTSIARVAPSGGTAAPSTVASLPTLDASKSPLSSVTDKVTNSPSATADVPPPTPKPAAELALPGGSLLDMTDIKTVAEAEGVKTETPSPFSINPFSPKFKPETGVQIEKLSSDAAEQPKTPSASSPPEMGSVGFNKTDMEQNSSSSNGLMAILEGVIKLLSQLFSKTFGRATPTPPSFAQPLTLPTVQILARPSFVTRGVPIELYWISSGTGTSQPCQVTTQDGLLIAQSNSGTRTFRTDELSPQEITFTASCFSPYGQMVQQSASVTIE